MKDQLLMCNWALFDLFFLNLQTSQGFPVGRLCICLAASLAGSKIPNTAVTWPLTEPTQQGAARGMGADAQDDVCSGHIQQHLAHAPVILRPAYMCSAYAMWGACIAAACKASSPSVLCGRFLPAIHG